MSYPPESLRRICRRFRVLVLGRRNAGKTTILKKMAGSEDGACEVRDHHGKLVKSLNCLTAQVTRHLTLAFNLQVNPSVLEPTEDVWMTDGSSQRLAINQIITAWHE
jgi:ABC-type hemin transport system ATPase subunit